MIDEKEVMRRIMEMSAEERSRIMQKACEDSGIPYPKQPEHTQKKGRTQKPCTKCPLCGGRIEIYEFFQSTRTHRLTKTGKVTKRYTQTDDIPEELWTAECASGCGAYWDTNECIIDNGYFYDEKYAK